MRKKDYSMKIEGPCLECGEPGVRILNMRMRRPDTGATWGPNLISAVFCAEHGDRGADIWIDYRPRTDGHVHFNVRANGNIVRFHHQVKP